MTYYNNPSKYSRAQNSEYNGRQNYFDDHRDDLRRNKGYYGDRDYGRRYERRYHRDEEYSNKHYTHDYDIDYTRRSRSVTPDNQYRYRNDSWDNMRGSAQTRYIKEKSSKYKEERDGTYHDHPNSDSSTESKQMDPKYSQDGRVKTDDASETDGYTTIIVRSLTDTITEEDIDSAISDISIRNGFSPPDSVTLKTIQNNMIQMYYSMNDSNYAKYDDQYPFTLTVERVAIVKFPSSSAASRFMASLKSRTIKISAKEYFVEYYTVNTEDIENNISVTNMAKNGSNAPDLNELATLLQKRRPINDWNCPSCRFLNFAKRSVCLSCGIQKPSDDILESQNIANEIAALNQVQMLQSNLSDISSWIIIKNIPGDADPARLVLLVCKTVPDAALNLQRCVYIIDTNENTRKGFMFAQFTSALITDKYVSGRGEKKSEVIKFGNSYIRIDTVRSREKHVAEELFKNVKFNLIKINYEFNTNTLETTLTTEDSVKRIGNSEIRTCRIKTANIPSIETAASSNDAHSMSLNYLSNWVCDSLWIPTGKPDTATFVYDPNTDYFFDHSMSLYYDAASGYYMSLNGDYYLWDEGSSSLKSVDREKNNTIPTMDGRYGTDKNDEQAGNNTNIAGVLAAAIKVAQVSKENVQQLSSVMIGKKQLKDDTKPSMDIVKTFDVESQFDDECDMEIEDKPKIVNQDKPTLKLPNIDKKDDNKEPVIKALNLCLVCLRMFDTVENLAKHERGSKYHQSLLSNISA